MKRHKNKPLLSVTVVVLACFLAVPILDCDSWEWSHTQHSCDEGRFYSTCMQKKTTVSFPTLTFLMFQSQPSTKLGKIPKSCRMGCMHSLNQNKTISVHEEMKCDSISECSPIHQIIIGLLYYQTFTVMNIIIIIVIFIC